jgi:hypothetical protein
MSRFSDAEKVGLRDMETNRLIAVYPYKIEGSDEEIEDKVKFWFYQQSCSAEDKLRNSYVDALTPDEIKSTGS